MQIRKLYQRALTALAIGLAGVGLARAQTQDLYLNTGLMNEFPSPQIDALAFANYGTFVVSTLLPYEFQNTRYFTNAGTMIGFPGFNFQTAFSDRDPQQAQVFINEADASVQVGGSPSSIVVAADLLRNQGLLSAGAASLIRLSGNHVDLSRSRVNIQTFGGTGRGDVVLTNSFIPDIAIDDIWWTGPTNININLNNFYRLDPVVGAVVTTPPYEVTLPSGFTTIDAFSLETPTWGVYTNQVDETNTITQAIFVGINTNLLNAQVVFSASGTQTDLRVAGVQLTMQFTNSVTGALSYENLFLIDDLGARTNWGLFVNELTETTFRPGNYRVSRLMLPDYGFGTSGNGGLTEDLFFQEGFSNTVVEALYTAYAPLIQAPPNTSVPNLEGATLSNLVGRLEIGAQTLDLSSANMRANGLMSIQAEHLVSTRGASLQSSGFMLDLKSTNGTLRLEADVSGASKFFDGPVYLWSALWTNYSELLVTNEVPGTGDPPEPTEEIVTNIVAHAFHTFLVDAYALGRTQQAAVHTMRLRSTNIVVADTYRVVGELLFDGEHLENEGTILVQAGQGNFGVSNAPTLKTLVNRGTFSAVNLANFGSDRATPYQRLINHGEMTANSIQIRTDYFENSGTVDGNLFMHLRTDLARLQNGFLRSGRDLWIEATDLKLHRATNTASRALRLDVSNSFTDSGGPVSSQFSANRGFQLNRKPAFGDLLGTRFLTSASANTIVDHVWAAQDRGVNVAGYRDNVAIGRLVLSSARDGLLRFQGPDAVGAYAIYVDYLDLQGFVLQAYNQGRLGDYLQLAPNVTLYFAYANVPVEDLDGALNGQVRWVMDFVGPNSSVLVGLPSGGTVLMNRGRRESLRIDDDGDGIANGFDPFPWPDPKATADVIESSPLIIVIRWTAAPSASYQVEVAPDAAGPWERLATATNPESAVRAMAVEDRPGSDYGLRFYRVLLDE
jgi:hypothetical protein